jgi:hypothetical protein
MDKNRVAVRLSKEEKKVLVGLALKYDMRISEYIKYRVFDQNPDYIEGDIKFISPDQAKNAYFLAMSQVKLMKVLQALFEKQGLMTKEEFLKFDKQSKELCVSALANLGYRKIEVDTT